MKMLKRICDICGKEMKDTELGKIKIDGNTEMVRLPYEMSDACDKCFRKVVDMVNELRRRRNES
jgi:hypothetical protein